MKHFLEFTATNGQSIFIDTDKIVAFSKYTEKASAIYVDGVQGPLQVNTTIADLQEKLKGILN